MKSLAYSLAFFLIGGFAAGQTGTKTTADFQAAAHWFDYDSKQPLDIHWRTGTIGWLNILI